MGNQIIGTYNGAVVTVSDGKSDESKEKSLIEEFEKIKLSLPAASGIKGISNDLEKMWVLVKEKHDFRVVEIVKNQNQIINSCKELERKVKQVITPQINGSVALLQSGKHTFEVEDDYNTLKDTINLIKQDIDQLTEKLMKIDEGLT